QKAFTSPDIQMQTVSEYIASLEKEHASRVSIEPHAGSWESTLQEQKARIPFALWDDPKNNIHQELWKLAAAVIDMVEHNTNDPHYDLARSKLDKGLASCAWWWASERILGAFSPLTWNPTEIEKGAFMLQDAIRSCKQLPRKEYTRVEKRAYRLR